MFLDISNKNSLGRPASNPVVGAELKLANIDWIAVHEDESYIYLLTKYILGCTTWAAPTDTNDKTYSSSDVFRLCNMFSIMIGVYGNENFESIDVEGSKGYCHLLTQNQANGQFNYFTDATSRIGRMLSGEAKSYWLSTPYTSSRVSYGAYYIYRAGQVSSDDGSSIEHHYGFRPYIIMKK